MKAAEVVFAGEFCREALKDDGVTKAGESSPLLSLLLDLTQDGRAPNLLFASCCRWTSHQRN